MENTCGCETVKGANHGRWYMAVLGIAIIFYAVSCAPGALWQDSGMSQYRVLHNDIEGGLGLALSHPLYYMVAIAAKYVPFGELTHKVNLVSALAAAFTVANIFLLMRLWLGSNLAAIIAAISFGLSHTFWGYASIAEVYTLYTATFTAELVMLLLYCKKPKAGYLYWLAFLNGLGIANHMFGIIPLGCYFVFLVFLLAKKQVKASNVAVMIVLWVIGAGPYEYLIIKNMAQSGEIASTLTSAFFGAGWQGAILNTSMSFKIIRENVMFIGLNFPTPNILLFFLGFWGLFRFSPNRAFRNLLAGLTILFFIFAARYTVPDRYTFFIPFYCLGAVFIGLGVYFIQTRTKGQLLTYLMVIFALLPVGIYAIVPKITEKMQFNLGTRKDIPYRNAYEYFLTPWKTGYRGADRFAVEALGQVEENAVIYADGTTVYPLLLAQQVKGMRLDVAVVSAHGTLDNLKDYDQDVIDEIFGKRAVYVVSPEAGYCPGFLLERYDFVRKDLLYKAVIRK